MLSSSAGAAPPARTASSWSSKELTASANLLATPVKSTGPSISSACAGWPPPPPRGCLPLPFFPLACMVVLVVSHRFECHGDSCFTATLACKQTTRTGARAVDNAFSATNTTTSLAVWRERTNERERESARERESEREREREKERDRQRERARQRQRHRRATRARASQRNDCKSLSLAYRGSCVAGTAGC